jgi:hypothetical protein
VKQLTVYLVKQLTVKTTDANYLTALKFFSYINEKENKLKVKIHPPEEF